MQILVIAASALILSASAGAAVDTWSLAITIDDVPMTGASNCPIDEIAPTNSAILDALSEFNVRATAFVVPGSPCQASGEASPDALAALWRSRGHEIGNHTFSHNDYNNQEIDSYLADVERAHAYLEPILVSSGQMQRWFRPPLLHTGSSHERREALHAWLATHEYRMGVVTIDNQEWVFAAAYERASENSDGALMEKITAAYVTHIQESVDYYRRLSQQLFQREVSQVLLLHANRLNADHLPALLDALQRGGARFVSLDEAMSDPAFRSLDNYVGPRGLSWLQRWALTRNVTLLDEPREPEWIARAARSQ